LIGSFIWWNVVARQAHDQGAGFCQRQRAQHSPALGYIQSTDLQQPFPKRRVTHARLQLHRTRRISHYSTGLAIRAKYIHRDPVKGPPRYDLRKPLHPRDDPDYDDINEDLDQLREDTTVSARQPPSSRLPE